MKRPGPSWAWFVRHLADARDDLRSRLLPRLERLAALVPADTEAGEIVSELRGVVARRAHVLLHAIKHPAGGETR